MTREHCEYCGQEDRYGHNAICIMNTVEELRAEVARLRTLLRANNHHLAKLVNGTDEDNPATWTEAQNQVLATRAALLAEEPQP